MDKVIGQDEGLKAGIVKELADYGCCNPCILRYLGNADPFVYREEERVSKLLFGSLDDGDGDPSNGKGDLNGDKKNLEEADQCSEPSPKVLKRSPCVSCLGLLDRDVGAADSVLDKISAAVKEANIQAKSYTINLSLPISIQFRAYFVWHRLAEKFPSVYDLFPNMKPEGICLKNVWKWICTGKLKDRVDPDSDWTTDGCLTVNVTLKYEDDETECSHLSRQFRKPEKGSKTFTASRSNVDNLLKDMSVFEFKRKFGNAPPTASKYLTVDEINCVHVPIFLAGRYNKYSRKVCQTPWIIDGRRMHDGSVEELISEHILQLTQAETEKFSASGREDVDVRMLGQGRPFLMEVIQPKRTLFTQQDISDLRDKINQSTKLIRVRDLQLVDKKCSAQLKEGEENKCKNYCALCLIPGVEITPEIIEKLNNMPVPIVLQQKTPIRVLHRRSLATRERSIYSIRAEPAKSKHLFKLFVKTQAGTYVKEFVHGDLGRTRPSVAELLGCQADIVSLDVESIDFPWPPTIAE